MDETTTNETTTNVVTETTTDEIATDEAPETIEAPVAIEAADLELGTEVSVSADVPAPPTSDLGGTFSGIAVLLAIAFTTVLARNCGKYEIALKPFIPWLAFGCALFLRTIFESAMGQPITLEVLQQAVSAGTGAVFSHTGVRSLVRHLPALLTALNPPSPPPPPAAA